MTVETVKAEGGGAQPFKSLVVIEFAPAAPQVTIDWVCSKIKLSKNSGGAGLTYQSLKAREVSKLLVEFCFV
jgi:hypothetical protein